MKLFKLMKDGGKESRVHGFFFIEWKRLFSVVLLRFADGSREAFHSHAFNSISWVLRGELFEYRIDDQNAHAGFTPQVTCFLPRLKPVITTRDNMHQVRSNGTTWVLSFRGPWANTWKEWLPKENRAITLTHGREEVAA